jgi:hypothetical protein
MPHQIDFAAEDVADVYRQLQPWVQRSLEEALIVAAADPQALPGLPEESEYARILDFADGRGLALLDIDEDDKRITVRMIQPPR